VASAPSVEPEAARRALIAFELAEQAFDPVDPPRGGSPLSLSVSLNREAAYWGLSAGNPGPHTLSLAELFDRAAPELARALPTPEAVATVRKALVERSFKDTALLPPEVLAVDAAAARELVRALLRRLLGPRRDLSRLYRQRAVRCGAFSLLILGLLSALVLGTSGFRRAPNLAAGKPWRASSSSARCHPEKHSCAGVHTDMFFQTNDEREPWVELDLGASSDFNAIRVTNRSDCCPDRAVPLLVEVSNDREKWREVVRREDSFSVWQTKFVLQRARYLRLRVARRTIFHLDKIEVKHVR
jgi:hypothetical protein